MQLSVVATLALLTLVPAASAAFSQSSQSTQARPTDQELSTLIARRISEDTTLSTDAVKVTVNGGVVTLAGLVAKDADKKRAEKLAHVAGVVRVVNNLKSREKATDAVEDTAGTVADTSKKGADKAKRGLSKTGEVITDAWISTRINANLLGEDALDGSEIKVESRDQIVTLSGTVPTAAARARALAIAKDIEGVKRVVDKLKVTPKARES